MVLYHVIVLYPSHLALNVHFQIWRIHPTSEIWLDINIFQIAALQCDYLICSQEGELYRDLAQCCGPCRWTGHPIELLHWGVCSRLKLHWYRPALIFLSVSDSTDLEDVKRTPLTRRRVSKVPKRVQKTC